MLARTVVLVALVSALLGVLVSGCPLTDDRRPADAHADARDAGP